MLATVITAVGMLAGYMHVTFARASDVTDIKAIVLEDSIHRRMYRYCEQGQNAELKRRIDQQLAEYRRVTGLQLGWVCHVE